jgi:hypothetical protein
MRLSLCAAALAALPDVFAGGVFIINRCPFPVNYVAVSQDGSQDPPGVIASGASYEEDYKGVGRAIELSTHSVSSLLVFGYSKPPEDQLVWYAVHSQAYGSVCS